MIPINPLFTNIAVLRERIKGALKSCHAKVGKDRIMSELKGLEQAVKVENQILESSLRVDLRLVDAMIFALSSLPNRTSLNIVATPGYEQFLEILYAMRQQMADERDEQVERSMRKSFPQDAVDGTAES